MTTTTADQDQTSTMADATQGAAGETSQGASQSNNRQDQATDDTQTTAATTAGTSADTAAPTDGVPTPETQDAGTDSVETDVGASLTDAVTTGDESNGRQTIVDTIPLAFATTADRSRSIEWIRRLWAYLLGKWSFVEKLVTFRVNQLMLFEWVIVIFLFYLSSFVCYA